MDNSSHTEKLSLHEARPGNRPGFLFGAPEMARGTVKWFNETKGYGFITPEDGSTDVFVHYSVINAKGFKTLKSGARVEFDAMEAPRGLQATRVVPLPA